MLTALLIGGVLAVSVVGMVILSAIWDKENDY